MYRKPVTREMFLNNLNEKRARAIGRTSSWRRRNHQREVDFRRKECRYNKRHIVVE